MIADPAPVIVFAYRRPEHLRRTLMSLMQCPGFEASPVLVYGDGPRNSGELAEVEATRNVARELLGPRAEYHFSETNMGLSRSVIRGVGEVLDRFDRVIVMEDDLCVAPGFLLYMNAALERYADAASVYQVSGYQFAVPEFAQRQTALFLPITVSWGWATWRRAWEHFDADATGWQNLRHDNVLRRRFNLNGAYDYSSMLEGQMAGFLDSWAIRWYWSVFRHQGKVVFPPVSLVSNTGFDGSGTHGRGLLRRFASSMPQLGNGSGLILPGAADDVEDSDLWAVQRAVKRINGGWLAALADKLRHLLHP